MSLFLLALTSITAVSQAQHPKLTEYLDLTRATLENPVTHEELSLAVLSPEGAAAIRDLFERTLELGITLDNTLITPELGGEAMLHEGALTLVDYPDPVHPIVRELVALQSDPSRLLASLQATTEGRFLLDNTGGLHALLYQLSQNPPTESQSHVLTDVIRRSVQTHFKTWSTDPLIQAESIETTTWRGRYVGFWHLHPPRVTAQGFGEGIEPSVPDMHNAVELGQFLTLVFQPDGFDLYDLSDLAKLGSADLSRARVIQYRDVAWRAHFEALLRKAQGERTP